nr:MAG TPA_asm: hypothetical protein [Caudoviricetes sp.]
MLFDTAKIRKNYQMCKFLGKNFCIFDKKVVKPDIGR